MTGAGEIEPVRGADAPELLITENETNERNVFGSQNAPGYFKDGINDYVVNGASDAINPDGVGTKSAARYRLKVSAGKSVTARSRAGRALLVKDIRASLKSLPIILQVRVGGSCGWPYWVMR